MTGAEQLGRLGAAWRRRPRVTARGWVVGGGAGLGVVLGIAFADAVLIQIGLFLAVLWGLSMVLCYWNLRGVMVRHEHAATAFVGETIGLRLRVSCRHGAAYALEIADELWNPDGFSRAIHPQEGWPFAEVLSVVEAVAGRPVEAVPAVVPKGALGASAQLTTRCRKRGIYESFQACLSSEFPFGLFRRSIRFTINQALTIYPQPAPAADLDQWLLAGRGGEHGPATAGREVGGEFRGMREFAHGDARRLIHWPLSARFGELVVREFEATTLQETLVIFHSCQPSGKRVGASAERALEILTGICCGLFDRTLPVTVCAAFNDWDHLVLDNQTGSLEQLLRSFAAAKIVPSADFRPLIDAVTEAEAHQRIMVVSNIPVAYWAAELPARPNLILLDNSLACRVPGQTLEEAG